MLAEGALRVRWRVNGNIGDGPSKDTKIVDGHASTGPACQTFIQDNRFSIPVAFDSLVHPWHLNTQRQLVLLTELEMVVKVAAPVYAVG